MQRVLLILVSLVLLTACGGSTAGPDSNAPVERVKGFVAAAEAKDVDAMVQFLLPDQRRDAAFQLRQVMATVESIEYRDPVYTPKDNDGTTAHVQVSGVVAATTVDGESAERQIDQLLTLVNQDGQWYINGSEVQLP